MEASDFKGTAGPHKLRLKVVSGNAAGDMLEVQDELVIGRQAVGVGTLANDIEISRTHARITGETDGRFVIEDLGSTNGTSVNDRRIEGATTLEVGDKIEMGASVLVVQVSTPQPTPVASETVAPPSADAAAVPPPFTLRIEVDVAEGKAIVALDEGSDEVDLVHEDGRWRLK